MDVRRKSSVSGPLKPADKQVTVLKTIRTMTTTAVPPPSPVGVISSKTVSITDAYDYAQWAAEFLEELKNKKNDQEGNPFCL
jgi:hypothetical protein